MIAREDRYERLAVAAAMHVVHSLAVNTAVKVIRLHRLGRCGWKQHLIHSYTSLRLGGNWVLINIKYTN